MNHNSTIIICLIQILIIFYIPVVCSKNQCPTTCNCTTVTQSVFDHCKICLQKFYKRSFTYIDQCPCIAKYVQNIPPTDYCCAQNCVSCYQKGCYSCKSNWTLVLIDNWYVCQCKENYFYDLKTQDCLCLADNITKNKQFYYEPTRFECYACPIGCKCDNTGCYFCNDTSHRVIYFSAYNVKTCYCDSKYFQTNGICVLLKVCQLPMINIKNNCVCNEPYYLHANRTCTCKSHLSQTLYYKYLNVCYICPKYCKCNRFGCYYCESYANRTIIANNCSCHTSPDGVNRFIEIDGQCKCISPYNWNNCQCNSIIQPEKFYISKLECKICPKNCTCKQQILKQCSNNKYRNINGTCKSLTLQLDGECIGCSTNFIYINNQCICPNIKFSQFNSSYYFDQDISNCVKCPKNCTCKEGGCIDCNTSTHRLIKLNSKSISTCYCMSGYEENSDGICQCSGNTTYDNVSAECVCSLPYILSNNLCLCSAEISPNLYYYDQNTNCQKCPLQCNCTNSGCIWCSENTGRVIMISKNLSICPCLLSSINQPFQYCLVCSSNQYVWRNKCMDCHPNCETCNATGCKTCSGNKILQNNMCMCTSNDTQNNIRNQQGNCVCAARFYLLGFNSTCMLCPKQCQNCQFNNKTSGKPFCVSCHLNVFRVNKPSENCPCLPFYSQDPLNQTKCCHSSCKSCNASGCQSCFPYTFRYLNTTDPNNFTCSCYQGFSQTYQNLCKCPPQTYLQFDKCLICPVYCSNCNMFDYILNCSCLDNINRVTLHSNNYSSCVCKVNFIEIDTDSTYCYPEWCADYSTKGLCAKCISNRKLSSDNLSCICQDGYYLDQNYECKNCSQGCIYCSSFFVCNQCSTDYYRIFNQQQLKIICIKPIYEHTILYQSRNQYIFMARLNQTIKIYNLSIYLIKLEKNAQSSMVKLLYKNSNVQNSNLIIMQLITQYPLNITYFQPYLFYINGSILNGTKNVTWQIYYYINTNLYDPSKLTITKIKQAFTILFLAIIITISLILHVMGNKQNELMYCSQTLFFISMNVNDIDMVTICYLNYFRITAINLIFADTTSPLNKIVPDWDINIQYSVGNYKYFSIDNNLLRNSGLALYLAIQNVVLLIIFRIVHWILYKSVNTDYRLVVRKYQKIVYRVLQWTFKVTMYPLIFFSLSTIIAFKKQYSLQNQNFRQFNFRISIAIIAIYIIVVTLQHFYNNVSKLYKYEMLIQTIFDFISAITIVLSTYQSTILVMIPIMLLRSSMQLIIQYLYLRDFDPRPNSIIFVLNMVQCSIVAGIYYRQFEVSMFLLLLYYMGIIIFRVYKIVSSALKQKYHRKDRKQIIQSQAQLREIVI